MVHTINLTSIRPRIVTNIFLWPIYKKILCKSQEIIHNNKQLTKQKQHKMNEINIFMIINSAFVGKLTTN